MKAAKDGLKKVCTICPKKQYLLGNGSGDRRFSVKGDGAFLSWPPRHMEAQR